MLENRALSISFLRIKICKVSGELSEIVSVLCAALNIESTLPRKILLNIPSQPNTMSGFSAFQLQYVEFYVNYKYTVCRYRQC